MILEALVVARAGAHRVEADLSIDDTQVVAIVGPNGAGKTTLVRALAGLQPLEAGRVVLDGEVLEDVAAGVRVPPERRGFGVVLQEALLLPHLDAASNVAYGMRCHGVGRGAALEAATGWLRKVGASGTAGRRPAALSTGERQRVALARALATRPRALLLDEPLSAVDPAARPELRRLLREQVELHRGIRLVVTHDAIEALTLGGRLVVVEDGRVAQDAPVAECVARPRSAWVAAMVGINLLTGTADGAGGLALASGVRLRVVSSRRGPVLATVHPRAVGVHRAPPSGSPRNVLAGDVVDVDHEGDRVRVRVAAGVPLVAEVTPQAAAELHLDEGGPVWLAVKATEVDVYDA